jgi:hypothetical protein
MGREKRYSSGRSGGYNPPKEEVHDLDQEVRRPGGGLPVLLVMKRRQA